MQEKQNATEPAEEKPAEPESAEHTEAEKPEQRTESPVEPMPEAPTELPTGTAPESTVAATTTIRAAHGRQPSLSIQSKLRSSSFRKSSISQGSAPSLPSAAVKSPSLPPLTGDGDSVHEVFRKQSARIEELEKDNKRLEKEVEEVNGRWRKTEDQLEDLREASVDAGELKDKLEAAEKKAADIDKLVS